MSPESVIRQIWLYAFLVAIPFLGYYVLTANHTHVVGMLAIFHVVPAAVNCCVDAHFGCLCLVRAASWLQCSHTLLL